jgi:hypothetical protein
LPTALGDARLAAVWAVLSAVVAAAVPLGDGGWATWAIRAPIFGAIMFVQLRRKHRRAGSCPAPRT